MSTAEVHKWRRIIFKYIFFADSKTNYFNKNYNAKHEYSNISHPAGTICGSSTAVGYFDSIGDGLVECHLTTWYS